MVVAQAAGDIQPEGAVRLGDEAHIPEGGMDAVIHAVAEGHLQLAGHVDVPADGQQIVAGCLGPGQHVEGLAGLHAGQRAGHDVAGVVAAAAAGDDVAVDGALHQDGNQLGGQVVQLDGLAGGQLQGGDAVLAGDAGQELQPGAGQAAAGHAQAQHVFGAVPLGVGAEAARSALVVLAGHFARGESPGLLGEFLNLVAEEIKPLFVHERLLLWSYLF